MDTYDEDYGYRLMHRASRRRPGVGDQRRMGFRGIGLSSYIEPTLLSTLPSGAVWLVDSTVEGTINSDGNYVATALLDQVGSEDLGVSATPSKYPKQIPTDYLANSRKAILLRNATSGGTDSCYFESSTPASSLWNPLVEAEVGPGSSLVVRFIPRLDLTVGQVIGIYPGNTTTPGFYILVGNTGVLSVAIWKAGVLLVNYTSAAGVCVRGMQHTVSVVMRTDRTYSIRLDGVEVRAASTLTTSTAVTFTHQLSIGARSGSDGLGNMFGGEFLCAVLYHTARSDIATIEGALNDWYDVPTATFDTGPVAGATVANVAKVAVLGTSIDAAAGYADYIAGTIGPTWLDLSLTFIGANASAASIQPVMATGSTCVRGLPATQFGFDSISAPHANRMDTQLATMFTAGDLDGTDPLVVVCPIGWVNDLRLQAGAVLQADRHGDLLRMLVRLLSLIRGYSPGRDVRFVLYTATPVTAAGSGASEVPLHNRSARLVADALAASTSCPVALADVYSIIQADLATYQDPDLLHLLTAGQNAIAPLIANCIRYVLGLS